MVGWRRSAASTRLTTPRCDRQSANSSSAADSVVLPPRALGCVGMRERRTLNRRPASDCVPDSLSAGCARSSCRPVAEILVGASTSVATEVGRRPVKHLRLRPPPFVLGPSRPTMRHSREFACVGPRLESLNHASRRWSIEPVPDRVITCRRERLPCHFFRATKQGLLDVLVGEGQPPLPRFTAHVFPLVDKQSRLMATHANSGQTAKPQRTITLAEESLVAPRSDATHRALLHQHV